MSPSRRTRPLAPALVMAALLLVACATPVGVGFRGFRLGDFLPTGQGERLVFLRPYVPDRIPLVLVHGTFSSPATWAGS